MKTKTKMKMYPLIFVLVMALTVISMELSFNTLEEKELPSKEYFNLNNNTKILIALHPKVYKEQLTRDIMQHFKSDTVYFKIIDIRNIPDEDIQKYNAVVIGYGQENGLPLQQIRQLAARGKIDIGKLVILTSITHLEAAVSGVNPNESASGNLNVFSNTEQITLRIESILKGSQEIRDTISVLK